MNQDSILFITLDSCRYDTFKSAYVSGCLPNISSVAPLHRAISPSYFTYGSHAAMWMGFTPGVEGTSEPLLNPKAGKLFRMSYAGFPGKGDGVGFTLEGSSIIDGFRRKGYLTIGTGAVNWFNPESETGRLLTEPFEEFWFSGNTWNLKGQLKWVMKRLLNKSDTKPVFLFLNIGETHVPYWHEEATWPREPSPCIPFGGSQCCAAESSKRQRACLEWVDSKIGELLSLFSTSTILICADHGDCWGEDGIWEHGVSHSSVLTVPFLLRLRGKSVYTQNCKESHPKPNPNRTRNAFELLKQSVKAVIAGHP